MYSLASTAESTEFTVVDPTTGIPTNADSTPTATLRRNESASGVTVTVTNLATGQYRASWTNGAWTAGDRLTLKVSATVSSNTYTETIWEAKIDVTASSRLAPTTAGRTVDVDANGYVERVVLCDTTTTNSDMRGTDSAFLAANAPANFGDLAITASTGKVTVGTNDDKTDYALSASGVTAVQSGLATAAAISALNDVSTADIDARLAAYDAPTKSEMDAAFTEIKGATWSSLTDTLEAIRNRGDSAWITATGFSTLDAAGIRTAVGLASANLDTQLGSISGVTDKLNTGLEDDGSGGYQFTTLALENGPSGSGLDAAGVRAAVGLASANLDTQFGGVSKADKLLKYIQLIARSDSAIATDNSTELGEINADGGSGAGDYSPLADSLEASQAEHDTTQTSVAGVSGGSLTITPVVGVPYSRTDDTDITLYLGELRSNSVTIVDSDAVAVNLAGRTLQIVIEDIGSETDIQVIENANITVSGDSSNTIAFTNNAAVTASTGVRKWTLWDLTNDPTLKEVIVKGKIWVKDAAVED